MHNFIHVEHKLGMTIYKTTDRAVVKGVFNFFSHYFSSHPYHIVKKNH